MRWVWLFALVAACKSDETKPAKHIVPAPVTFASGSRLHAMFHEAATRGWNEDELRQLARMWAEQGATISTD